MQGIVSLRDYEGIQGFGASSASEIEELNKALQAGYQRPPASGGSALRVESLEATLRIVTFTLQNIKLWKAITKLPAFSTVEEYNLLTNYGADAGVFTNEGDLPQTQDSTYQRQVAYVKFLGTTREVTHPMTLVRPANGNIIGLETQNGAVWLVERLERALFAGRSDSVPQSFDGIESQILAGVNIADPNSQLYPTITDPSQIADTVVIDMRGADLDENILETAANFIVQNYGTPTDLFLAPYAMSQLAKEFYPRERVNLPYPTEGKVGLAVNSMVTNAGLVQFNPDIFLRSGRNNGIKTPPTAATSANAPSTPTSIASAAPGVDANSQFTAANTGTFFWAATAINNYGESAPTAASSSQTIPAGDSVVLTITAAASTYPITGYRIYRGTSATVSSMQYVTTLPAPATGSITYTDRNWFLPGTSRAYMLQQNIQNLSFRQLAPMLKIPLATIAASIRWMQLLYGTPIIYTPAKNVVFINVGDI